MTFANLHKIVLSIDELPDRKLRCSPRILKRHFDPRCPRIVYLVRNPRDIALSWYFYIMKVGLIPDGYSLDEFVQHFVVGSIAPYADGVGCWEDHVLSWIRLRSGTRSFRLVRDEDLLAQPVREPASLAPFLRIELT